MSRAERKTRRTASGSATGQPSIVLPCGFSKDGLPIGLQLTGKRWGEAKLLAVAKVLEKLLPPCPVPPNYA